MDDPDSKIPVDVVFLLVVKDPDGYVSFLAALTNLFQDPAFIATLHQESPQAICQELDKNLTEYQLDYQGDLLSQPS
jgi:mannitol/fructose-specific phosphotransferase system IIA component (Ntr-type)